jgi:hypothetical protein
MRLLFGAANARQQFEPPHSTSRIVDKLRKYRKEIAIRWASGSIVLHPDGFSEIIRRISELRRFSQ